MIREFKNHIERKITHITKMIECINLNIFLIISDSNRPIMQKKHDEKKTNI